MNVGSADGEASLAAMSRADVIRWWELRRIPYNIALLVIGAISLGVAIFLLSDAVATDVSELPGMFRVVAAYAVAANAFYTLGWVVELIVRRFDPEAARKSAEVMFRWGLVGSCALTATPLWLALIVRAVALVQKP